VPAGDGQRPEVLAALQTAAQLPGNNWVVSVEPAPDGARRLAEAGAALVVADGAGLEATTRQAAQDFPRTYFIQVDGAGAGDPLPNLLVLGGTGAREDQLGFAAGLVAGYVTEARRLTAIANVVTPAGLKYRNGFLHGVRYACSRCLVDFIDLTDDDATALAAERARMNASLSSDVVFAGAGAAGAAGLRAAAEEGAWVLGAGSDIFATVFDNGAAPGAHRVLTGAYFDHAAAVAAALEAFAAGTPFAGTRPLSAATGAVRLAEYRVDETVLSLLDRQEIERALGMLADGSLETGVDPETGNEL
jgi:basic membrane lipoprotein Med (substrate-binding protein (PBP1-ABC) superfamily)